MATRIRLWAKPWILSSFAAILVFGIFHQFLVYRTPTVFGGLFFALLLSLPLVVAYASLDR